MAFLSSIKNHVVCDFCRDLTSLRPSVIDTDMINKIISGDKYEAIKSAAQGAIDMSKQAASVYKVYVDTGAKPDDRYMAQARNLFGTDDQDTVLIAYSK